MPQVVYNLSKMLCEITSPPSLCPSQLQHTEHFQRNVTSDSFEKNNGPLYGDMGIEKGIKITIPACPAAQYKLLGCYMLLYAVSRY